jgi:hypothetical protein
MVCSKVLCLQCKFYVMEDVIGLSDDASSFSIFVNCWPLSFLMNEFN